MLGNATFYSAGIRKAVSIFGTLFNEIFIDRVTSTGAFVSSFKVPIGYSPKQKYIARTISNPDLQRDHVSLILPRMAFEISGISYDNERTLNKLNKITWDGISPTSSSSKFMPVPYNINFELSILVLNAEDGTRIVEQILPFFTPEFTVSANLIGGLSNKPFDIPIVLEDISVEDIYDGDFETRRTLVWTLNFVLKTYLFGPTSQQGVIRTIDVNLFEPVNSAAKVESVHVELGIKGQTGVVPATVKSTDNYKAIDTIITAGTNTP